MERVTKGLACCGYCIQQHMWKNSKLNGFLRKPVYISVEQQQSQWRNSFFLVKLFYCERGFWGEFSRGIFHHGQNQTSSCSAYDQIYSVESSLKNGAIFINFTSQILRKIISLEAFQIVSTILLLWLITTPLGTSSLKTIQRKHTY